MKKARMENILRTFTILDALRKEEGRYRLGEISEWSWTSRTTTYRYLKAMSKMKLIIAVDGSYGGKPCAFYSVTKLGRDFLEFLTQ